MSNDVDNDPSDALDFAPELNPQTHLVAQGFMVKYMQKVQETSIPGGWGVPVGRKEQEVPVTGALRAEDTRASRRSSPAWGRRPVEGLAGRRRRVMFLTACACEAASDDASRPPTPFRRQNMPERFFQRPVLCPRPRSLARLWSSLRRSGAIGFRNGFFPARKG